MSLLDQACRRLSLRRPWPDAGGFSRPSFVWPPAPTRGVVRPGWALAFLPLAGGLPGSGVSKADVSIVFWKFPSRLFEASWKEP